MNTKPLIAIVGKPNVGKSTFFNKIVGERISIVSNVPGVTRDRIYADAEWLDRRFTLIDTGGIQLKSEDLMHKHIKKQAELAMDIARRHFVFRGRQNGAYLRGQGGCVLAA